MPPDRPIPVKLARVVLRDGAEQQWIFLQELEGPRGFPIVIGTQEAAEIHRVLGDQVLPRPLTHQLALATVEALGSKLVGVDIVDLKNNTFYARLRLSPVEPAAPEVHVDARPSDALALALRAGAPLRVMESVLEQARTDQATDELPPDDETPPPPPEGPTSKGPETPGDKGDAPGPGDGGDGDDDDA